MNLQTMLPSRQFPISPRTARTRYLLSLGVALLLLLAFCEKTSAETAEPSVGLAHYALLSPTWPCEEARKAEANLLTLHQSVLWNTFGTDFSCLDTYINDNRLKTLQIHLINEVCQRNNRCGAYEFLHGMTTREYERKLLKRDEALLKRLKDYVAPVQEYLSKKLKDHTRCLISPGLESNLSNKAAAILIEELRPLFPQCRFVWNPVGSNRKASPMDGIIHELHHADAKLSNPCVANLDGQDIQFPSREAKLSKFVRSIDLKDYVSRTAQCEVTYLWIAEFNGLASGSFVDPRARGTDRFPSPSTFRLLTKTVKQLKEDFNAQVPEDQQNR